jgi:hypothetical protein
MIEMLTDNVVLIAAGIGALFALVLGAAAIEDAIRPH